MLHCQDCGTIAEKLNEYATITHPISHTRAIYQRGFPTGEEDPKGRKCIICECKHWALQTTYENWNTVNLCYYCKPIKAKGVINYVRKDQSCLARSEYEGDDVPDSWAVHHDYTDCADCAYYRNLRKK